MRTHAQYTGCTGEEHMNSRGATLEENPCTVNDYTGYENSCTVHRLYWGGTHEQPRSYIGRDPMDITGATWEEN